MNIVVLSWVRAEKYCEESGDPLDSVMSRIRSGDWAQDRGHGLNELAVMEFTPDDRQQFAQLTGYSLSGYGELSYVTDDAYGAAATMADEGLSEQAARIAHLEHELSMVRSPLREPIARLYGLHPDDLNR